MDVKEEILLWIKEAKTYLLEKTPEVYSDDLQKTASKTAPVKKEAPSPLILKKKPVQTLPQKPALKPKQPEKKPFIKPIAKPLIDEFLDVKQDLKELGLVEILEEIPSDDLAKQKQKAYLLQNTFEKVTVIRSNETGKKERFLEDISWAISREGLSAKLSTYQDSWDLLSQIKKADTKLFILSKEALFASKNLLVHFKELPEQNQTFLADIPLIVLPDLSNYFQNPSKKKELWSAIKKHLQGLL